MAQTDSERIFALAVEQEVVMRMHPQQRQTTEIKVQTEEQPALNAVDIVLEWIVQGATKVTAEVSM